MKRRLRYTFNGLTALSLVACLALVVLWVRSFHLGSLNVTLPPGKFLLGHCRGQVFLIHHRADLNPGSVWTTVYVGRVNGQGAQALVKALIFDPASPPDLKHPPFRTVLLSRPYLLVDLAQGTGLSERGGFRASTTCLPGWRNLGSVLQCVAIPYWFVCALTCVLPARWIHLRRRRHRAGTCAQCGYDLRATPDRCPECGAMA
jgi:hypothetical protein